MRITKLTAGMFLIISTFSATTIVQADLTIFRTAEVHSKPEDKTNVINTKEDKAAEIAMEAKRWGLSKDDYQNYLELMQSTPSGLWYKNLDPAEVLAINAKNDADRKRYAEIIVSTTHDRLENELAMQHAYDDAWKKLYPNLKPIAVPGNFKRNQSKSVLQAGDRILLFTTVDDANNNLVNQLLNIINNKQNTKLAIFIVGRFTSDREIKEWAQKLNIPPKLVQTGTIVLDHDNGRFDQISKGKKSLPTVVLDHQGSFSLVSINDLNA